MSSTVLSCVPDVDRAALGIPFAGAPVWEARERHPGGVTALAAGAAPGCGSLLASVRSLEPNTSCVGHVLWWTSASRCGEQAALV